MISMGRSGDLYMLNCLHVLQERVTLAHLIMWHVLYSLGSPLLRAGSLPESVMVKLSWIELHLARVKAKQTMMSVSTGWSKGP